MLQIACIYIVVPQQKWNDTYSKTTHKLERTNVANFHFQDEKITRTKKS